MDQYTSDVPRKQCKRCERWLPEDKVHFYYANGGIPYSPCKECRGYKFGKNRVTRKEPTRDGYAWCTQCDKELELTCFTPNKRGGVDSRCRNCRQANKKKRRLEQPDIVHEEDKKCRLTNRDKRIEQCRQWRENNHEYALQYSKEYNRTDERRTKERLRNRRPDVRKQRRDYSREYNQRPEVIARRKILNNNGRAKVIKIRYRARKLKLPNDFSRKDWNSALEYFGNCCAVCGRPRGLWHTLAADHWIPLSAKIPNNPGTVKTNIVPLCHGINGCNNSKSNSMPEDWLLKQFGKLKAKEISSRINNYFNHF